MATFDKRVQMMDAGTALFDSENNYGFALGQLKAELELYGKIWRSSEFAASDLPGSTAECDLFLDCSNLWRKSYVSCSLQATGERAQMGTKDDRIYSYAAVFKEGHRSSCFRAVFFCLIIALLLTVIVVCNPVLLRIAAALAIFFCLYSWIAPSTRSVKRVKTIIQQLSN